MPAPDLVALVIELAALMPTHIDNHMGRAVQKAALDLIVTHQPDLAQSLHDREDLKPFTVSGLMRDGALLFGDVEVGCPAWIRVTGQSAEVADVLLAIADHPPTHLEIDRMIWRVTGVHVADHSWAGKSSYQTLIERHVSTPPAKFLELTFFTPTTFRSQSINLPLPTPTLVFGSLLSRWMAFTAHRLRDLPMDQLDAYIAHHVFISRYNLRTMLVRGKNGGKEIGFVGEITYELSRTSDYLHKHSPELEALLRAEGKWFARTLALLADFAFYSGVGRKTTTGMGMARGS